MMMKTRQIQLKYRPKHISEECFHLVDVELPELKSKQVLIKNLYMSVDPYMRLSMEDGADLDAWKLDSALDGPSIGVVVDSKNKKFKELFIHIKKTAIKYLDHLKINENVILFWVDHS